MDIDPVMLGLAEADQRKRLAAAEETALFVRASDAALRKRVRRAKSANGSRVGGEATAKRHAKPALRQAIARCLDHDEPMRAKEWSASFWIGLSSVYRHIKAVKKGRAKKA